MDWSSAAISTGNDPELIGRFRRRDPAAAGEMYDRYGRLLFALILNIVGNREAAEDVLLETFLKASNQIQTFKSDDFACGSWLLILARNHALQFREEMRGNKERKQNRNNLESPALYLPDTSPGQSARISPAAQKAFSTLPEMNRIVLELAWFEGMTFDEISLRLDVPQTEVIALAKDSLTRIRDC